MSEKSGIYRLRPYAIPKPWGGGHLDALTENQSTEKIGEYVIFSDLKQFPVGVEDDNAVHPLADFWRQHGMLPAELPFMLKILSTAEPISLQNHPADADVAALGLTGNGKFECWSILDADVDARAYLGLREGEDVAVLRNLENDANPLSHFNEYFPRRGDIVQLKPGLIHSTTGRLLFYEIQQKSDHTFRLYDFGRGRTLHTEQAIHCMRDQKPEISLFSAGLQSEKFCVAFHEVLHEVELTRAGSAFSVFTWFGAVAEFACGDRSILLHWGDSVLVTTDKKCTITRLHSETPAERFIKLPMIDMLFEAYV